MQVSTYLTVARMSFLQSLAYRAFTFSILVSYPVIIFANYFLYTAIFASNQNIAGFTLSQMFTYITVGWIVRSFYRTEVDGFIGQAVVSGDIALDLMKPVNLIALNLARAVGESAFRFLSLSIPLCVIFFFLNSLMPPHDTVTFLYFILSVFNGYLLGFGISFITGVSAFFFESSSEISWTVDLVVKLLAGLYVPLNFFPDAIASVFKYLPFQGIHFIPLQIYLGKLSGPQISQAIASQMVWLAIIFTLCHLLLKAGTKKLSIQGG
ncbi:MAG: ABC-2 family transporter protein [Deltaproteobacteria bacterium]|nr:ABC-2 family transporter protein [Deltaproteobacteria bacterium]